MVLSDKLKQFETDKQKYERILFDKEKELSSMKVEEKVLKQAFKKAKKCLKQERLKIGKKLLIVM